MILIFDLDDTLYDERDFVESGIMAVAKFGHKEFNWPIEKSFNDMIRILDTKGRGKIFDTWLIENGICSKSALLKCVKTYRHHKPMIELCSQAKKNFPLWNKHTLYLVTDGHKVVQDKKVKALGLYEKFKKVFITHRYGIKNAKPSLHCFKIIKDAEKCLWGDMVYIGDNPAKDFVALNKVGAKTIRIKTGVHKDITAKKGFDAKWTIENLYEISIILEKIANE